MKCEYCGGEVKPPREIEDYAREMYVRPELPNPTHIRICSKCHRVYAGPSEGGPFILLKPTI